MIAGVLKVALHFAASGGRDRGETLVCGIAQSVARCDGTLPARDPYCDKSQQHECCLQFGAV